MRRVSQLLKLLPVVPQTSPSHARYFIALPPEPGTFQGHGNRLSCTDCGKRVLEGGVDSPSLDRIQSFSVFIHFSNMRHGWDDQTPSRKK